MNKLTPEQALGNLYQAARLARLTAEEHQVLAESAQVLRAAITPKPEPKE